MGRAPSTPAMARVIGLLLLVCLIPVTYPYYWSVPNCWDAICSCRSRSGRTMEQGNRGTEMEHWINGTMEQQRNSNEMERESRSGRCVASAISSRCNYCPIGGVRTVIKDPGCCLHPICKGRYQRLCRWTDNYGRGAWRYCVTYGESPSWCTRCCLNPACKRKNPILCRWTTENWTGEYWDYYGKKRFLLPFLD